MQRDGRDPLHNFRAIPLACWPKAKKAKVLRVWDAVKAYLKEIEPPQREPRT